MTTDLAFWPFVGRELLVHEIKEQLSSDRGVILAGGAGFGKTALAQQTLAGMRQDCLILHIRGTAVVSRIPYGAIGFLLSELDEESMNHPILVLRGLTEHLEARAEGRKVVLFVDNIEDLDELSAMTISHLAAQGTVLLVAVCETIPGAPQEFLQLWRDGVLHRVDVGAMSLDETIRLLRTELKGPISRTAAQELWMASEGNPLFLRALTHEEVSTNNLVRRDDVWVLLNRAAARRGYLVDVLIARLDRLIPVQRATVELVALAGSLPLALLLKIAAPADIDALQERGTLVVEDGPERLVCVPSSMVAEVVRANVPPGRSCELRDKLVDASSDRPYPPVDVLAFATWTLNCGAHLDVELGVRAAQEANNRHDPDTALWLLGALGPNARRADAVCERAKALSVKGRPAEAWAAIKSLPTAESDLPFGQWVELMLVKSSLARGDAGHPTAAGEGIRHLCREITHCTEATVSGSDLEKLLDKAKLAEIELAVYEGRYADVRTFLEMSYHDCSFPESFRLEVGGWLSEVWTMTGRQDDGVRLAEHIAEVISRRGSAQHVELAGARLCQTLWLSGRWTEFAAMLKERRGAVKVVNVDTVAVDEILEGALEAYCGRSDTALEALLPSLGQLRIRDVDGLLTLALAATAYTYSLRGDAGAVSALLDEISQYSGRTSWSVHRAARFLAVMASVVVTSREEAAAQLLRHVEEDHPSGAVSYELFLLSAAVRLGRHDSAGQLAAAAAHSQGPLAQLCGLYAGAVVSADAEKLVEAARMARALGHYQWCQDAAEHALALAMAGARTDLVHRARELIASRSAARGERKNSAGAHDLTAREREISLRAAAGATNKSIAKDLSVSVRTVEGHLHQIYGKLQVSSRAELEKTLT